MKEVRMRYPSHVILGTEFAQQVEVVLTTTLIATVQRDYVETVNTQILQMTLAAGCTSTDIDRVPWFDVVEVIAEEVEGNHLKVTALVRNSHHLNAFGRSIGSAVIAVGSSIGIDGAEIIIRGTPTGCQAMVAGFRAWNASATVAVVRLSNSTGDADVGLTPHQTKAFEAAWRLGYYNRPRGCTLHDVAQEVGVSRATVSGHLGSVEVVAHARLAERLGLRSSGSL